MSAATIASLMYVCQTSADELRDLTSRLETVGPRQAESVLKAIQQTGDVLSSALDRVSHFADELPGDAVADDAPEADRGLLLAAMKLSLAVERGICPVCGGIAHARSPFGDREVFDAR